MKPQFLRDDDSLACLSVCFLFYSIFFSLSLSGEANKEPRCRRTPHEMHSASESHFLPGFLLLLCATSNPFFHVAAAPTADEYSTPTSTSTDSNLCRGCGGIKKKKSERGIKPLATGCRHLTVLYQSPVARQEVPARGAFKSDPLYVPLCLNKQRAC